MIKTTLKEDFENYSKDNRITLNEDQNLADVSKEDIGVTKDPVYAQAVREIKKAKALRDKYTKFRRDRDELDKKITLKEDYNLNESYASKMSRQELEDTIYEILDQCIAYSMTDIFYQETGLDPYFKSLNRYNTKELINIVDDLNEKGFTDQDFYEDYEKGIDWEPNTYIIREGYIITDNIDEDVKVYSNKQVKVRGSYHPVDTVYFQTWEDENGNILGHLAGYTHNDDGNYDYNTLLPEDITAPDSVKNYFREYAQDGVIRDIEGFINACNDIFYEDYSKFKKDINESFDKVNITTEDEIINIESTPITDNEDKEELNESYSDNKYFDYNKELGWTDEDIKLHKSINWKDRNYKDYEVVDDEFKSKIYVYGKEVEDKDKLYTFHKFIRSNAIYPPYYKAIDFKDSNVVGPMYDGRKHNTYKIHDRYETQELNDMLSESNSTMSESKKLTERKDTTSDGQYSVGDTIRLIYMHDEPQYSGKDIVGKITFIDDIDQIHMENCGLGIQPDKDIIELVKKADKEDLKESFEDKITSETLRTPRGTFKIYSGTYDDFQKDEDFKKYSYWFSYNYPNDEYFEAEKLYRIMSDGESAIAVVYKDLSKDVLIKRAEKMFKEENPKLWDSLLDEEKYQLGLKLVDGPIRPYDEEKIWNIEKAFFNKDLKNESLKEGKDINWIKRKLDQFPSQITIPRELQNDLIDELHKKDISYMIDDHIDLNGKQGDNFTFFLKYPNSKGLKEEKDTLKESYEMEDKLKTLPHVYQVIEIKENIYELKTSWETSSRKTHSNYIDINIALKKMFGQDNYKLTYIKDEWRDSNKEVSAILQVELFDICLKENITQEDIIDTNVYNGQQGDKVRDLLTGDIWTIKKHYQIGNYGYVQIEKNDIIRKLKMFADKNSPQDVNRYVLIRLNEK